MTINGGSGGIVAMPLRNLTAWIGLPLLAVGSPVILPAQMREAPQAYTCYGCAGLPDSDNPAGADQPESYMGRGAYGVPHYVERPFSLEERKLLREQFGIEDPGRLYLSDSSSSRYLVYDTRRDREGVVVMSHRVGAASVRQPRESWEELERRVRRMRSSAFHSAVRVPDRSLVSLDPVVRPQVERMLADARDAGFLLRVTETARSPERQAYLLWRRGRHTFTATSHHTGGWAVDVIVGDGKLRHRRTRHQWIAFRHWLLAHEGGSFRIIGTPARSWDWPHIEITGGLSGFQSIEDLLAAARLCAARSDLPVIPCAAPPAGEAKQVTSSPRLTR
jgi:hypothetical protein